MKTKSIIWVMCILLLTAACSSNENKNSQPSKAPNLVTGKWEPVSRAYRVQGTIENIDTQEGKIKSISLRVTKNMFMENNPIDYDFVGQTEKIYFEDAIGEKSVLEKLKQGVNIVIAFSQFAQPDGKVVFGAVPYWIYLVVDEELQDLQGNKVNENELHP